MKRCDEMLRKLRFFAEQIAKAELVATPRAGREGALELDVLEAKLDEQERELLEVNSNVEKLRRSHRRARMRQPAHGGGMGVMTTVGGRPHTPTTGAPHTYIAIT